ncbi:MAG TPA: ATP-dependent DNA ligase [candidate division Zixibacteria bacterium]|nr:ATP-dependent DNA ligase [candidate division Zixibacteria bacterium]
MTEVMSTSFKALAELGEKLEATRKRLLMIDVVSEFLEHLESKEVEPAVSMLLGRPFPKWSQQTLEVSWTTLSQIIRRITEVEWGFFETAFHETGDIGSATKKVFENSRVKRQSVLFEKALTLLEVRHNLEAIAVTVGYGSRERKERLITALLSRCSPVEAKCLVKVLIGEMRTGFHEGLMERAVSKAFEVPLKAMQRATMIIGDVGEVAAIAKTEGAEGLARKSFIVFRPVNLMLAQMANDVAEALALHSGRTAFEYKYDGARVQIHKSGDKVRVFSRRLTDVTDSLPEVVQMVKENIKASEAIVEGEVIAVDHTGSPIPFQHLMRRFRRIRSIEDMAKRIPVRLFLFDILYVDGKSLISTSYANRRQTLVENAGQIHLTTQTVTESVQEAQMFLEKAMSEGHEGLMAKKVDSEYTPGIRGKRWLKIKPVLELLDLAIVAAEYGYGRRHGWLSDYCLAARDEESGEFLPVGKTFKGLTDAEIIEMTNRLKELTIRRERGRVVVLPRVVVEVAYNEIQRSPKYECGMALRFARITRIREDKNPEEVDTIRKVRDIYERQFLKKGRYKTG